MVDAIVEDPPKHVTFEFPIANQEKGCCFKEHTSFNTICLLWYGYIGSIHLYFWVLCDMPKLWLYHRCSQTQIVSSNTERCCSEMVHGLGRDDVPNWNTTKTKFLEKYKDYCRGIDRKRDEIFKMSPKEDESLEDYVERF